MQDSISLCLPVYNEELSIEKVVNEWVYLFNKMNVNYEIVLSEDGSTDNTKEIIKKLCKNNNMIIDNSTVKRRGYSRAVISGIEATNNEQILCVDSDGQADPNDFIFFLEKIHSKDLLFGYRINRKDNFMRKIYSKLFLISHRLLFPSNLRDPSWGYVCFKKKFALAHKNKMLLMKEGFFWGFTAIVIKDKLSYDQIPTNHRKRFFGETRIYKLHKIPFIAFRNFYGLLKIRFSK